MLGWPTRTSWHIASGKNGLEQVAAETSVYQAQTQTQNCLAPLDV